MLYAIILSLALQAQISLAANGLPCEANACASYYENINGQSVSELKSAAKFPDSPDSVITLSSLDVPNGHAENYGLMIQAWVVAPQTGTYVFSTFSDDASEVFISTTPNEIQTEADMVKVVELTGCCRKVTGTVQVSLEAGKSYYLLGYLKEGPGKDYFQIGFTVNGQESFPISQLGLGYSGCFEHNIDYHGNDIPGGVSTDSATKCQAQCQNNAACDFWTWHPNGPCWLKTSKAGREVEAPFVSGAKFCSQQAPDRFSIDSNGALMWGNGYVCDDFFNDFTARVVCAEMGLGLDFDSWDNMSISGDAFTMDNLNCPSGASRLSDCTYLTFHNCGSHEAVRLVCAAAPNCTPGNSEFTEKMLARMDNAQEKFADCAADIRDISSSIGKLTYVSTAVEKATDAMDTIMEKVNSVSDKILKPPPKGLGVANILGKIPKVGIFVKMGLKAAAAVIDVLEPLADNIADGYKRVDKAVKVTSTVFTGLKVTSTPTSLYLTGSHKILEAAHDCGLATGYQCGTQSAVMEAKNAQDYPEASERLETFAEVGEVCHNVLNPVDMALRELAEWAENIKKLLEPILAVLQAVVDFVEGLEEKIDEFMAMISDSDEAQCALEIFEPVTDTINLLTCPISEVAGFVMHEIIDVMRGSISNMVTMAVTLGVNTAVEAIVPDNLYIHIPDFTAIIPVDFWVDTCNVAAVAFPGYSTTVSDILALPLPYTVTGQEIKDSIITDALEGYNLVDMSEDYQSVCEEAWNEMGVDFERCEAVLDKIADALVEASCQASVAVYDAEVELVKAQQTVYNAALDHFNDAQADFVSAQQHLAEVYADLESAYNSLESDKASCPSCRCGGCGAFDFGCHIEGVWCCPARHGCLAALHIAQGGVEVASSSVDLASDAVSTAQNVYNAAAQSLARELEALRHVEHMAELKAEAMELVCNPPAFEVVKNGDCQTNGLTYITERNECILAARTLGVTHHQATPSGNRQKWCGTWEGLTYLHFNTQTTGVLAVGAKDYPILQTAGNYGQDSWQLCKRRGTSSGTGVTAAPLATVETATCGGAQFHGTVEGAPCQFPFTYNGVTYTSCTAKDHDQLWCLTDPVEDQQANLQTNTASWGNCDCNPSTTVPMMIPDHRRIDSRLMSLEHVLQGHDELKAPIVA